MTTDLYKPARGEEAAGVRARTGRAARRGGAGEAGPLKKTCFDFTTAGVSPAIGDMGGAASAKSAAVSGKSEGAAMNGDLYKMARKAARKAAADAGYAFKSGWKRVGAHNQAQAADLIDAGGRPKGAALAWPGGAWTVYSGGAVIAEGQEGAR